jgi:hypothetical protein
MNFKDQAYWVYALQVKRSKQNVARIKKSSPKGRKAAIYIGCHSEDPTSLENDLEGFTKGKRIPSSKKLRTDLLFQGPLNQETAFKLQREMIHSFRKRGFGVYNLSPKKANKVYVILLSDTVRPKVPPQQRGQVGKPCVYVGETARTLNQRYKTHKEGGKTSSKWVAKYGIKILDDFTQGPLFKDIALRTERLLALKLAKEGYTVLGGH